ncbi:MAG: FHA domain-containing protein [Planctomycetota bacterium]
MSARLRVTGGPNVDHVYKINDDQAAVLGRSSSADVRVSDENASRKHCRLERVDGHWTITDLKSLNGTHVNRKRIDAVRLSAGDEIRIAATVYEFTIDAEPAPDAREERDGDETEFKGAPAEACVCAQCGRDLPKNAVDAGSATEIGGRLFCARCVVCHSGPEAEAVEPGHAAEKPDETGESSEFASLLRSLERATEADRLDEDKTPPPPPASEAEPPKPGASLLDRLRNKKQEDQ